MILTGPGTQSVAVTRSVVPICPGRELTAGGNDLPF